MIYKIMLLLLAVLSDVVLVAVLVRHYAIKRLQQSLDRIEDRVLMHYEIYSHPIDIAIMNWTAGAQMVIKVLRSEHKKR